MSRIFCAIRRKLQAEKAETLGELLISVLVISLGLTMFATALMTARNMLDRGETKMKTYYVQRNALEAETEEISGNLILKSEDAETDLASYSRFAQRGIYPVKLYQGNANQETESDDGSVSGNTQIFRYGWKARTE